MSGRCAGILLSLSLLLPCRQALAQGSDAAAAQTLFDSAKELMKEGKFAEACSKFERSHALDPAGGTLLHLAACREQEGKLASSWAHYNEALSLARRDRRSDREEVAARKVRELAPKLAKLTVVVEGAVEGQTVTRSGARIDASLWGTPLPIDRGEYELVASAPGYRSASQKVTIERDGAAVTVKVPPLEKEESAAAEPKPSTALAPGAGPAASPTSTAPAQDPSSGGTQRTIGIVMMGVGGAAFVSGGVFGYLSLQKKGEGDDACKLGSGEQCSEAGYDARKDAISYGNISTVLVSAGLVVGAVGTYLFVSGAPSEKTNEPTASVTPLVGNGFGGALVSGAF
jgi:hypothetical protein